MNDELTAAHQALDDFLAPRAEWPHGAPHRHKGATKKAGPGPSRRAKAHDRRERPLVEDDGLYFRVAEPAGPASSTTHRRRTQERTRKAAAAFRRAFGTVWRRIGGADRQALMRYWRGRGDDSLPVFPGPSSNAWTLIQLADGAPRADGAQPCDGLGAELTFPMSLAAEHPDRLPLEVARAVAAAWRYATRRHWRLVMEMIEDPLAAWEAGRKRVTHAGRERKLDALEAAHLRACEAELAAVLRRWGFEDAAAGGRERENREV